MPSPEASRSNLEAYWQRKGRPRSGTETLIMEQLLWQWFGTPEKERPSLRGLALQLGLAPGSHSHLSRLLRKMLREGVPDSFYGAPVTLADLEKAREVWKRVRARMEGVEQCEQYDDDGYEAGDGEDREQYAGDEYEADHGAGDEDEMEQPPCRLSEGAPQPAASRETCGWLTADESIAERWREVREWKRKNPSDGRLRTWQESEELRRRGGRRVLFRVPVR